jgi:hypothetical protein
MSQSLRILCKFQGTSNEYASIEADVSNGALTFAFKHATAPALNEAWTRPADNKNMEHVIQSGTENAAYVVLN